MKLVMTATALALLAGCVTAPEEPEMTATVIAGPASITSMDPNVSGIAQQACVSALRGETSNSVTIVGTEFSEANSAIYAEVGEFRAPWRCLTSNDGVVAETTFLGDEGAL